MVHIVQVCNSESVFSGYRTVSIPHVKLLYKRTILISKIIVVRLKIRLEFLPDSQIAIVANGCDITHLENYFSEYQSHKRSTDEKIRKQLVFSSDSQNGFKTAKSVPQGGSF